MFIRFLLSTILATISLGMQAALVCPPDITVNCHDDIHYLPLVGTPTVFGGSGQLRYQDQSANTMCNVGNVVRTWYLDANGNQNYDTGEHACIQNIYVNYTPSSTIIDWPADVTVSCKDNLPNDAPTWVSGPCDIVGVSKVDQVFETDSKACYKIHRNFTVINWCTHVPNTNIGIWYHTQVIKINDPIKPSILKCNEVILGTNQGCQATFEVSNAAIDASPCGQQNLYWTAAIDLWADGSVEYFYSHNSSDSLYLLPIVKSGQQVKLRLPFPVIRGYHKVTWSVHDQCGNVSTCEQKVRVKDDKRPTPYMHDVLFSAFEGDDFPLKVPARMFNLGSFDNCSNERYLKYSFSTNVNDTIRMINCSNAGFQFFTIYVTDMEGNQEFAEVFMLAYDNGACQNQLKLSGTVRESNNIPMQDVGMRLSKPDNTCMNAVAMSNANGEYEWDRISLYKDLEITPEYTAISSERLDVSDLRLLQDYIMGMYKLKNFEFLAADLNGDNKIRIKDLELLRDQILQPNQVKNPWRFSYAMDTLTAESDIQKIKSKVVLSELKGPLNYKAVYKGDISDANIIRTGKRSIHFVESNIENGVATYQLSDVKSLSGLQIALQLPKDVKNPKVESPYFFVNATNMHVDENNILRFIITHDFEIVGNQPLFSIIAESQPFMVSPDVLDESLILVENYATHTLRLKQNFTDHEVKIVPNPTISKFEILGHNVAILYIKNASGIDVPFKVYDNVVEWEASPGIYFVTIKIGQKVITKKLIKLN